MRHETRTSLTPDAVLARAKTFFAERVPHHSIFVEHEGPNHATFRGQGGEELAMAVSQEEGSTVVCASTLLFDQVVGRFFSTAAWTTSRGRRLNRGRR